MPIPGNRGFSISSSIRYSLCITVLLLVGCAAVKEHQKVNALQSTTNTYRDTITLGDYSRAAKFRRIQDSQGSWNLGELRKYKITSYEILDRTVSDDHLRAYQIVEIKYYNVQSMIEKTLIDRQLWEYDEEDRAWYLQGNLPQFQ